MRTEYLSGTQRADRGLRCFAGLAVAAFVVLGIAAFVTFRDWLSDVSRLAPELALRSVAIALLGVSALALLTLFALAAHLWRLGARAQAARRYPPPGMRVIRDTRVRVNESAARQGVALKAAGVVLAVLGCGLFAVAVRLYCAI
jgi:hypothetical protein